MQILTADNYSDYYVLSGTQYVNATSFVEGTDYYAENVLSYEKIVII